MYRPAPALQTPLPPLLEIPLIVIQPRPRNRLLNRLSQPGFVESGRSGVQLLLELSGHGLRVDVEVVAEELTDVGVFVVADEGSGMVGVGGVDVHVGGWGG